MKKTFSVGNVFVDAGIILIADCDYIENCQNEPDIKVEPGRTVPDN